jgi:excisionase family DNA binding protein
MASDEEEPRVGLPEAAEILGLHRATVNEMIHSGRIAAEREGPHWLIRRSDLAAFAASYRRPRNAPRRRPAEARDEWTNQLLRLLSDWEEVSVADLARVLALHPGNIRKYLCFLEADGVACRDEYAIWRLTDAGRRRAASLGIGPKVGFDRIATSVQRVR